MLNALIALTLITPTAPAQPAETPAQSATSVRVSHADLDLARPVDRRILDRRIAAAVERVCAVYTPSGRSAPSALSLRCRADTQARASQQRSRVVARAAVATLTADSR